MSALKEYDRAIDDLAWRIGGDAEATLGVRGQSIDGDRGGKRIFDDAASWRLMESMCLHHRNVAIARMRRIDAALAACSAKDVHTLRLAFLPIGGRASLPLVNAFTVGRVVLLGLALVSETAAKAHGHKRKKDSESVVEWLEREARAGDSRPIFERLRVNAESRLLPAIKAFAEADQIIRDASHESAEKQIQAVRREIEKGRTKRAESAVDRIARVVADGLRLNRLAGYE